MYKVLLFKNFRVILRGMRGVGRGKFPIQILAHYWEIAPGKIPAYVDHLCQQGIQAVVSFVPWQLFESDTSHSLNKFLLACMERKVHVTLIPTPELGNHLPYSSVPKEIATSADHIALDANGNPIRSFLPPKSFNLPSLFSPVVEKRYYSFLSRLNVFLADLNKNQRAMSGLCHLAVTSSYWKYYRSHKDTRAFSGFSGDRSKSAALGFRKAMESHFADQEFAVGSGSQFQHWKYREFDEVNRRWFYQESEDLFRKKTQIVLERNTLSFPIEQVEFFIPEADPSLFYGELIQAVTGGGVELGALSEILKTYSTRSSFYQGERLSPWVYWSQLGSFHNLSDSEKQYLILETLLSLGAQGGGVVLDEEEWLSLSMAFRSRAEQLAQNVFKKDLSARTQAAVLTAHAWSSTGDLPVRQTARAIRQEIQITHSTDVLKGWEGPGLLWCDSNTILKREVLQSGFDWLAGGRRILVLPEHRLYSENAKLLLKELLSDGESKTIRIENFEVREIKLKSSRVFLVPPQLYAIHEAADQWVDLLTKTWGTVTRIRDSAFLSDPRLKILSFERQGKDRERAVFVLNPGLKSLSADLVFDQATVVHDLARSWAQSYKDTPGIGDSAPELGFRFSLEVPPCGILPLAVDTPGQEKSERASSSGRKPSAFEQEELPGMEIN